MNTKIIPILLTCAFSALLFYSCEDSTYKEYKGYAPVYLSYDALRSGVNAEENVDLKDPGKIYFKDNFIFIIEELKGIHVFDNTYPSSPVKKTFINVPGAVDMAISGNIMYVDSYVDLAILDLQDINNIHEVGRMKDIIPYTVPATDNKYPLGVIDKKKGVVLSWELKTIRERIYINPTPYPIYSLDKTSNFTASMSESSGVSGSGIGIGGSMARFGIKDQVLYLIDNNTLKIIDITSKTSPVKTGEIFPGATVETIFITDKKMFLGTTTGMVIYDISLPLSPTSRIFFTHARSCDPVIVDDTLAFVTLRSGTACGGGLNRLDVVNIKDISHPKQIATYAMTNPHGLGKSGDVLFVCDGTAGLKVFDAAYPLQLFSHVIKLYPGINAYDVIPLGTVLVMIGDDGLFQYDYSNVLNINLLSKISVVAD